MPTGRSATRWTSPSALPLQTKWGRASPTNGSASPSPATKRMTTPELCACWATPSGNRTIASPIYSWRSPPAKPFAIASQCDRNRALASQGRDGVVFGLAKEDAPDDERHRRYDDRIPKTCVDVAVRGDHGRSRQRQHASEPSIADMVGQRHGRVADARWEELHEK